MLRRLAFKNFKSWPKAELELGSITGLFGTNSSGKTSLIQFLLLLKQTKDATDRGISLDLNGSYVSLGVYRDMIHRQDENQALAWDLEMELQDDIRLVDPVGRITDLIAKANSLKVSSEVVVRNMTPECTRLSYEVPGNTFSLLPKDKSGRDFELHARGGYRFLRTQGRAWPLPPPIKSYAFPDQARTYYQNASFLSELEASYEE
jgi:ABC-type dipeptide/oligopeptide/nickel transport system ATPase subunit